MSLRRRIEKSEWLLALIARLVGRYLDLCNQRIHWKTEGLDELQAALKEGPVLLVLWHSRSVMGAIHWPVKDGQLSSLHDTSPIARLTGAIQRRSGLLPIQMSGKRSNRSASRVVLKRVKEGVSIGITGDGPVGPAHELKDPPLEWARATGMPVFCYAYSLDNGRRLDSWDRMLFPRLSGNGAYVYWRFDRTADRKMEADEIETLRADLRKFMQDTTARADELLGLPPGP